MKNFKKIIGVVLLITIIVAILVAGTYAKYTSKVSGKDSATVAKWDIKAGKKGSEVSITGSNPSVTFNLFDTILDEDGQVETSVKSGLIAPGTKGSFTLSVKNDSEVDATYSIVLSSTTTNIPLEYKIGDNTNWASTLTGVEFTNEDLARGTSKTITIEWRWAYEGNNDVTDTKFGVTPETVEVTATITATQAN